MRLSSTTYSYLQDTRECNYSISKAGEREYDVMLQTPYRLQQCSQLDTLVYDHWGWLGTSTAVISDACQPPTGSQPRGNMTANSRGDMKWKKMKKFSFNTQSWEWWKTFSLSFFQISWVSIIFVLSCCTYLRLLFVIFSCFSFCPLYHHDFSQDLFYISKEILC